MDRHLNDTRAPLNQRVPFDLAPVPTDAHIDIEVHGGIAALTGQVNHCLAQWAAERAARRVPGAHGMVRAIGAASSASIRLSDADIARSAQSMLRAITLLPTGCIKVVVDGGWITLSGSVHWSYQKQAAAAAVRHAIGATGVTDRVTLVGAAPQPATRSQIGSVLGWR
jgi:osmotically-inducible protein OsmY